MQDKLVAIERLQGGYSRILEAIADSVGATDRVLDLAMPGIAGVPDTDRVRELEECLAAIYGTLSEHLRLRRQEILPTIARYAAELVVRGLLLEHEEILHSITELRERAIDLVGAPSERAALLIKGARIKEKLDDIRMMIQEHARKQELISELAYLAQEALRRETGQTPRPDTEHTENREEVLLVGRSTILEPSFRSTSV